MPECEPNPVPLVIFGVPFHNVTFEEAIDWIVARVRSGRPANIATANLDFVTRAWADPELQRILIDADLVLADGFPMVKLSPLFGPKLKDRVTGSDLTPMLAARAAEEGMSIYGLGSAPGVAEKALNILKKRHPGLQVAGCFSPPFTSLLKMDHREILQRLENAAPDILFVAFGAPKQDKFISMHVRSWNIPVSIGVGASLDFISGKQKRAPKMMQKCCLEWLWRVCCSPRRLFARYLANLHFLLSASRQLRTIHKMPDHEVIFQPLDEHSVLSLEQSRITVARFHSLDSAESAAEFIRQAGEQSFGNNLLLDLHAVPWLSSLELGALLEINKISRRQGFRLILYAARPKVRTLLETCRLTDYFSIAYTLKDAEEMARKLVEHADGEALYSDGRLKLKLPIELSAASLPKFEVDTQVLQQKLVQKGLLKSIEVDAAQLDFIDSAGLGYLIALKKRASDTRISMSISNLDPKLRRTFEIARVDKILLRA
ncbi:WecB/TagA/CpsF family glycosyltransferase [Pontiella agarivorans]|uniref:WecB/TagA/CpsF family glycosyltransferase n=1 Tax=Pontiella agarivorans TaxID=3038953 RepID=A0ABU5MXD6_9BACT|nr:WecB/TagA/CpsF family glycosyltransferase [Pontiella agarivorans]MDZ8118837.1 WecB/TagA/CpsF family glycosyltransferase [Pontiella agarivorans]